MPDIENKPTWCNLIHTHAKTMVVTILSLSTISVSLFLDITSIILARLYQTRRPHNDYGFLVINLFISDIVSDFIFFILSTDSVFRNYLLELNRRIVIVLSLLFISSNLISAASEFFVSFYRYISVRRPLSFRETLSKPKAWITIFLFWILTLCGCLVLSLSIEDLSFETREYIEWDTEESDNLTATTKLEADDCLVFFITTFAPHAFLLTSVALQIIFFTSFLYLQIRLWYTASIQRRKYETAVKVVLSCSPSKTILRLSKAWRTVTFTVVGQLLIYLPYISFLITISFTDRLTQIKERWVLIFCSFSQLALILRGIIHFFNYTVGDRELRMFIKRSIKRKRERETVSRGRASSSGVATPDLWIVGQGDSRRNSCLNFDSRF